MARVLEIVAILVVACSLADGRAFHMRTNEKQVDPDILSTVKEILESNPSNEVHAFEQAVDTCLKNGTKEQQRQLMLVSLDTLRQLDDEFDLQKKRRQYQRRAFWKSQFDTRANEDVLTILEEAPIFLSRFTDSERAEYDELYTKFLGASQDVQDIYIAAMIKATDKCANNEDQRKRSHSRRFFGRVK